MAETNYKNFARKYRPEGFGSLVGQESVAKTLSNSLELGRIAHAYLFYGPRGCGKTTTARILAKALNCAAGEKPTSKPCGKCRPCVEIAAGSDLDVLELDAASNTQVDKVREVIIETVSLSAARDRCKVFILDEVHMLSDHSFNALLKTIEEPPPHVVFILATTERHAIPATIASRCQSFRFRPITQEQTTAHLAAIAAKEKIEAEPAALELIAKSSGGALRDALTLLESAVSYSAGAVTAEHVSQMLGFLPQELTLGALSALVRRDSAALHGVFETLRREGYDPHSFVRDVRNAAADVFFHSLNPAEKEPFAGAAEISAGRPPVFFAGLSRRLGRVADEIRFSDSAAIAA